MSSRHVMVPGAIALALVAAIVWSDIDNRKPPTVQLATPNGTIRVELASTPDARAIGLSKRDRLRDVDGLLLRWDGEGRHPIWMANMRFSLDLVWLDSDGRVIAVLADVPPCHADPCPLHEPEGTNRSVAVLEMQTGAAARHRIAVGAAVQPPTDWRQVR